MDDPCKVRGEFGRVPLSTIPSTCRNFPHRVVSTAGIERPGQMHFAARPFSAKDLCGILSLWRPTCI